MAARNPAKEQFVFEGNKITHAPTNAWWSIYKDSGGLGPMHWGDFQGNREEAVNYMTGPHRVVRVVC